MDLFPWPKQALVFATALLVGYPNCLQTTCASAVSHESSHTVPQLLLKHTSTLPSYMFDPPTRRIPQSITYTS